MIDTMGEEPDANVTGTAASPRLHSSAVNAPTRTYGRNAKAMMAIPASVKEYPNAYAFIIDMPGKTAREVQRLKSETLNFVNLPGD
ncbi:unnamed protein product [Linum tenue]|uniref:Uncharacterized protein n=1 Tax=Linum tenue TaxID=586396 RepID=A0AAV0LSA9_9ROSI|nr:unnamed protein product [Linum tenue]